MATQSQTQVINIYVKINEIQENSGNRPMYSFNVTYITACGLTCLKQYDQCEDRKKKKDETEGTLMLFSPCHNMETCKNKQKMKKVHSQDNMLLVCMQGRQTEQRYRQLDFHIT